MSIKNQLELTSDVCRRASKNYCTAVKQINGATWPVPVTHEIRAFETAPIHNGACMELPGCRVQG